VGQRCHADRDPKACQEQCIIPLLGEAKGRNGNRRCPAHDDDDPSLSINPGTKGMRMVWCCGAGCPAEDVRTALLAHGADPSCLGRYGTPKRAPAPGTPYRGTDSATMAAAKRWYAVQKLPDINGSLLRMCIQALGEGDGDLPGDPYRLLPVNSDDFYALAKRAGVGKYRYQLFEKWLRSGGA
jgi:hypothetical protein